MCWSEEVSWSMFIGGTILNIITSTYAKNPTVTATCLIWQFVLFMQLFDALSWRSLSKRDYKKENTSEDTPRASSAREDIRPSETDSLETAVRSYTSQASFPGTESPPMSRTVSDVLSSEDTLKKEKKDTKKCDKVDNTECNKLGKIAKTGSYISNVLQPVVAFICYIIVSKVNVSLKISASIVCLGYISYILGSSVNSDKMDCHTDISDDCHIKYNWWENRHKNGGGVIYLISLILIILLLLRPFKFSILSSLYIVITLVITMLIYPQTGTVANMWCWFAAFAPFFTLVFWKLSN